MSFYRVSSGIYAVVPPQGPRSYLIRGVDGWIMIDGGPPQSVEAILGAVLELTSGEEPSYLIATSCAPTSAASIGDLSSFLRRSKVVSHYPDSMGLRRGECMGSSYKPSRVSLELEGRETFLDGVSLFLAKTPTLGAMVVRYMDVLIIGSTIASPLGDRISYLCNINNCIKVN
jgi:glyoxylase-like metal-dependent hydrolase (beta-lactamase superfamily II)